MCRDLRDYYKTDEGIKVGLQIAATLKRLQERSEAEVEKLSIKEEVALAFIKGQLLQGKSPSVRDVAEEVKFKSSKSGARLVNMLIFKGYVVRERTGKLRLSR